jgi:hypothetical protein
MGLQDPQVTNEAYRAKLWWIWVKENSTPWKPSRRPSMPRKSTNRIEFVLWAQRRDQPSGIYPGATKPGSINTVSGK